jgi:drug/metabolite transporter (DMT)-like permease
MSILKLRKTSLIIVLFLFQISQYLLLSAIQIQVARATIVLSTLPTVMAAGLAFLDLVRRRDRRSLLLAAGLLSTVAGK